MRECVIVFARYPLAGEVKTRLAAGLGTRRTLALYKCFVRDTLAACRQTAHDIVVCYTPRGYGKKFPRWTGRGLSFRLQHGSDLGKRMKNAFRQAFHNGYDTVVVVGCDTPGVTPALLRTAFTELAGRGCVLGPSVDGGYYLLGFTRKGFCNAVFEGIRWGTAGVLTATLAILERRQHRPVLLPLLHDIDTVDDLKKVLNRNGHFRLRGASADEITGG